MSTNFEDSFDIETSKDEEDEIDKSDILTDIIFEPKQKSTRFKNSIFKKGFLYYRKSRVSCTLTEKCLIIQKEKSVFEIKLQNVFAVKGNKESFSIFTKFQEEKIIYSFVSQDIKSANEWISSIQTNTFGLTKELKKRKVLVLINPYSGVKKSEEMFNQFAKPILDHAHLVYEVYISKEKGDITKYVKLLDLYSIDEFCVVGGDGTFFECIQGMLGRVDWKFAIQKPVSIIPCGTGNALAQEVGAKDVETAAFIVARGFYKSLDIASVLQQNSRFYCSVGTTWGFIAQINHETDTDFMRSLGSFRYDISALKGILKHTTYEGDIYYLEESNVLETNEKLNIYEYSIGKVNLETDNTITTYHFGPPLPLCEKFFYPQLMKLLGKEKKEKQVEDSKSIHKIHRELVLFSASNIQRLTQTYKIGAKADMNDGCIDLVMVKNEMGVLDMFLSFVSDFATGDYIQRKEVEYIKTRAFYLVPKNGSIVVDGELVGKTEPLLCEVHKGLIKVFTL